MSTQDKRAIVDKIFGFHILNQMRDLLKEESKKIKEEMDRISGQIDSVLSSIQKSNSELEDLLSEIERESTDQVNNLKEALEKLESIKSENSKKMEDLCKEESNVRALVNKSDSSLLEAKGRYKDVGRKLSLYNNDKCPTCETSLDTEFHMGLKKELEDEYQLKVLNLESQNQALLDELTRIKSEYVLVKKEKVGVAE